MRIVTRSLIPIVVASVSLVASATLAVPPLASEAAVGSNSQAQAPLTVRDVARLRSVTEVAASPEGARVAYVLSVPRPLPLGSNRPGHGLGGASPGRREWSGSTRPSQRRGWIDVERIAWTPDGRSIAFLMKRGKKEDSKALWAIPADGGEARLLLKATDDISSYSLSPDGKQVAFLATEALPAQKKAHKEKGFSQEIYEEEARPVKVWIATLGDGVASPTALDLPGSASELRWSPAGGRLALALAPLIDDDYMSRQIRHRRCGDG
jgi:hypothetical protein